MIGLVSYFMLACAPELPASEGLALQDQRDTLRDAALLLASDSSWTPVAVEALGYPGAEVALSALPVAQPTYDLVDENGNPFELRASLLPAADGERDASAGFAVAVDPDLAAVDGAMEYWLVREGELEHGYLALGEVVPALDVPTFVVTVGSVDVPQVGDDAWVADAKASTTYLCLCGAYISSAKDSATSDEFELYVGSGNASSLASAVLPYTTSYKFDGSSHTDAAGSSTKFVDMNSSGRLYCANTDKTGVALKSLSSSCYTDVVPIEDDRTSGQYVPSSSSSGSVSYDCGSSTSTQYYSKSVSTVTPSGTSSGTAYIRNSTTYSVDPDDWYGDAYYGFNTGTSTSVKSYKPTNVTLYMVQDDKCSDSCSSWASTNGCNTN